MKTYSDWTPKPRLHERIKQLRLDHDMVQDDLARAAHVSRAQITNIEAGKSGVTLNVIVCIARAFGMTASELLAGVDLTMYE